MYIFLSKRYKSIAIILGIVLITEVLLISIGAFSRESSISDAVVNEKQELQIAADISNMTGVSTDRILELKSTGRTWNEVIELLKHDNNNDLQSGKDNRSLLLMNSGIDEQAIESLIADGYSEQEITDAKLLAERVVFQLRELVQSTEGVIQIELMNNIDNKDMANETFRAVAEKFDLEAAVRFMLTLEAEFGSYEAVLDEYLSALQLELNLASYVTDKEEYERDKETKRLEHLDEPTVSLSEIERALLDKIQNDNASKREEISTVQSTEQSSSEELTGSEVPLPDVPSPSARDVKPDNPTQSILEEINLINPNDPIHSHVKETR